VLSLVEQDAHELDDVWDTGENERSDPVTTNNAKALTLKELREKREQIRYQK
jgi:hypothetical protein